MVKKLLVVIPAVLLVLAGFAGGFYYAKSQTPVLPPEGIINTELEKPLGVDFSLFWKAWQVLEQNFVDPTKIDYQQMVYGAISGMVSSLKDPYTVYMPPEDSKIFKENVSGEFSGVGMEIGIRNNELTVISPLDGTPAKAAGIMAGDKIAKIDGIVTTGLSTDEAVKLIRGPKGTKVVLTMYREGWSQTKDIEITRDVIEIVSVSWEMKEENIAYIKLAQFSETARPAFNKVVAEIIDSPAQKIILDLRNDPGGYLEVAQNIAGWFLEYGQTVTIEDFGGKEAQKLYLAQGNPKLLSYPLVILINQGSASASEILAGALRDNRGIQLIGETSFGKGSVQTLEELSKGSLKITIANWLTPKGAHISGVGLEPDIKIELTEDDYQQLKDPQLDKAIEVIKGIR
jgi:carboxyl-terminal processing protease